MNRRYSVTNKSGTLMIEMADSEKVTVEIIELGMGDTPLEVVRHEEGLILKSSFFMFPDVIHELHLTPEEDGYIAKGSYAMFGEIDGMAKPFKGRTKYEVMLDELPSKKTGISIGRSEKEIQEAIDSLMAKMTLEEKIGQMSQGTGRNVAAIGSEKDEVISESEAIAKGMLGSVIAMTGPGVIYEQQKLAVEKSRLGIPLFFCQDVIHGYETIFPIPLAWSCSFNPDLLKKSMAVAAKEASSQGLVMGFSPMLDIARDPRWGRVSESNGEDPYLCSMMSKAHVEGFQGESLGADDTLLACMKHFVGYSAAEGGRDYNTTEISETTLNNVYLRPFQAGIESGAASIMNAFNVLDGMPLVGNKKLCNDHLRDKMAFDGILLSDFGSVDELVVHGVARNNKEAAELALNASLDVEMGVRNYHSHLKELIDEGKVAETMIDTAVRRVLYYKYKSGLMDDPFKYLQPEKNLMVGCEDHMKASYDLAMESAVLLKNNGTLPLNKELKVALIGPKGDSTDLYGPWQFSKLEAGATTIKEALINKGFKVDYAIGSEIEAVIEGGIESAVEIAKDADVILLALGETKGMSGEAASKMDIHLPQAQMKMAEAMAKLGKPMVTLLVNGRPLVLDWFENNVDSILETWFLGARAGEAIADLLDGTANPSGKLSMTFPKHAGQIPIYYNHLRTGRPYVEGDRNKFLSKYIDGPNAPLYYFGYGLSYTDFELSDVKMDKDIMPMDGKVCVSAKLKNTGLMAGSEVIQLYCWDTVARIARPVKELIGFKKIHLEPGQEVSVSFDVTVDNLSYINSNYEKALEPGEVILYIGTSACDKDLIPLTLEVVEG